MERDFEWGWQPHWMAIDLARLVSGEEDAGARPVEGGADVRLVDEVPEYDGYGAALMSLTRARPQRSWHALARVDGAFAGRAWAHLDDGELASAGIYDVDVPRRHRRRGIGRAVTLAVCRAAAGAGARVATLNATGEGELLYRALGFRSLGLGQTWWLHNLSFTKR
jgi:ribosomal protein S18 acetylase RimI-like enzyme